MTRGIMVALAGSRFSAEVGSGDGGTYDIVTGVPIAGRRSSAVRCSSFGQVGGSRGVFR